jgi:hypothetical protein
MLFDQRHRSLRARITREVAGDHLIGGEGDSIFMQAMAEPLQAIAGGGE